jgi:HrpA-like RNA helicase
MPKILKMKDKSDNYVVQKKDIDNIPFRTLICGKTGAGKTSLIGSLLLLPDFYGKDFKGENIYIFSPLKNDYKMQAIIEYKDIPEDNVHTKYDDETLGDIYDELVNNFENDIIDNGKPVNSLILLDDISFSGALKEKQYGAVNRVFMNGRKSSISIIITSQKYSQIGSGQRSNASSMFFYNTNMKERELFELDANYLNSKKGFMRMLTNNLKAKRDFIYVDYSEDNVTDMYKNTDFKIIDTSIYNK